MNFWTLTCKEGIKGTAASKKDRLDNDELLNINNEILELRKKVNELERKNVIYAEQNNQLHEKVSILSTELRELKASNIATRESVTTQLISDISNNLVKIVSIEAKNPIPDVSKLEEIDIDKFMKIHEEFLSPLLSILSGKSKSCYQNSLQIISDKLDNNHAIILIMHLILFHE